MRKHETQNAKHETAGSDVSRLRGIAGFTLLAVLLVLALRMTMTETLRQTLLQKAAWLSAVMAGKADEFPRVIGPEIVGVFAAITALLAAAATGCAVIGRALTPGRIGKFLLVAAIVVVAAVSASHAANRYTALVGTIDLAMGLLAGWSVSVLCQRALLGDMGRRIVIAALVAFLAAWTLKGLHQRFIEFPDTIAEYQKNREARLKEAGIRLSDEYARKLFESRVMAQEVAGFLSLSNVAAAGMIGMIATLVGLLTSGICTLARPSVPEAPSAHQEGKSAEIPLPVLTAIFFGLLLLAALGVTLLTGSRGGFALSLACAVLIPPAIVFRETVVAWRRTIVTVILAGSILGAIAIVAYGIRSDSLPSKSLTFRWHYWTAASTLIRQSPMTGVGLNNFGEHYVTVKRPSTPEDVSDPHSFLVRFAAEAGMPAAIFVAGLILWQLLSATRRTPLDADVPPPPAVGWPAFYAALAWCAVWWIAHFYLADAPYLYNVYFVGIFALLSAGAAWAALTTMQTLPPGGIRGIVLAMLAGAFAMLVYDQINMALVTGPVAMLFWVMLGAADSYDPPASGRASVAEWPIAVACIAAAAGPFVVGRLDLNSAPYEYRFLEASQPGADANAALTAISNAIARAPRSIELRTQRVLLEQRMHLSSADDIRQILQLDRANARPRIMLAKEESDLPPAERAKILEEALRLDLQLPADELKRLPASERADIEKLIEKLKAAK